MKNTLIIKAILSALVFSSLAYGHEVENAETKTSEVSDQNASVQSESNKKKVRGGLSSHIIRIIDVNEDGLVSREEYMAHAQQRFSDLDLDDNEFVSYEEAKEAAEIMRKRQNEARTTLNERTKNSETE